MNLIEDRWIPVRRQNGEEEKIAPWELTSNFEHNPIVALAAPRPDFQGGLMQFLIGLLQTATPPDEDNDLEWEDWFEEPPKPEELRAKFDPFVDCFHLDGDRPRFMQDLELRKETPRVKENSIYALLIDAPGENTLKKNKDHFVKRNGVQGLCYSCAATALFTLQTNAPSGGAGHRTSLRGGGPLTTLVALDPQENGIGSETLWHNTWLNILDKRSIDDAIDTKKLHRIFPWLAPTRTSEKKTGKTTYQADVHPLQMYWGMPRRIRLNFDHATDGICDVCGDRLFEWATDYITLNYGVNYEGWQHHLSPHRIDKQGNPLPHHPHPGGFPYGYWLDLSEGTDSHTPAKIVTEFKDKRKLDTEQLRLWIFGYDMDNDKSRNWYETTYPIYLLSNENRKNFAIRVEKKIEASELVEKYVRDGIKDALSIKGGNLGSTITESFYANTEREFFNELKNLYDTLRENGNGLDILERWYEIITDAGEKLFETYTLRGDIAFAKMKRVKGSTRITLPIVEARKKLKKNLKGPKLRKILQISK